MIDKFTPAAIIAVFVALNCSSPVAAASDIDLRLFWNDGIRAESADGDIKLKFGGRIMGDFAFFSADDNVESALGKLDNDSEFRRARLYVAGQIHNRFIFKAQYDFAESSKEFKDVYLGLTHLPVVGTLKIGHYKEPFSLEELTSSKYITFIERSLPGVFAPSRNTGISIHNSVLDDRLTYGLGVFQTTDKFGKSTKRGDYGVTGRVTGLPWRRDDTHLLHIGSAFSHRQVDGDTTVSFSQRPEAHLSDVKVVDTGSFTADSYDSFGFETAFVSGPFSAQGEYVLTSVDMTDQGNSSLNGWYVYASWFPTGESRNYKGASGTFGRVHPKADFLQGGFGAVEIALRYSQLDLNDFSLVASAPTTPRATTPSSGTVRGLAGGKASDITAGVNWYLNPNVRVMFNYVHSNIDDPFTSLGSLDAFQTRFQVDF